MIPSLLTDSVTYDLDRAIHYALLWGLEGLELRRVGGPNDRVPFINEQKLRHRTTEADLPVVAVEPGMFLGRIGDRAAWLNELAELDETLEFCRRIGCERIVASSFLDGDQNALSGSADALRQAGRKAERSGALLCVLNQRGHVASTGASLAALLDVVDHDAVRAAWNPSDALISGEEPEAGLEALGRSVELVRCRNVARRGNGWEARPIDNGGVDWTAQLRALARVGYDGPLCLEVDVEPAAQEGLRSATALIRLLRSLPREVNHENE